VFLFASLKNQLAEEARDVVSADAACHFSFFIVKVSQVHDFSATHGEGGDSLDELLV